MRPAIASEDPMRATERSDNVEPRWRKSSTVIELPRRAIMRKASELPRCKKSNADRLDPSNIM